MALPQALRPSKCTKDNTIVKNRWKIANWDQCPQRETKALRRAFTGYSPTQPNCFQIFSNVSSSPSHLTGQTQSLLSRLPFCLTASLPSHDMLSTFLICLATQNVSPTRTPGAVRHTGCPQHRCGIHKDMTILGDSGQPWIHCLLLYPPPISPLLGDFTGPVMKPPRWPQRSTALHRACVSTAPPITPSHTLDGLFTLGHL